ncbi:hypothetical protein BDY21DRAFT_257094, partial [Lineolata rhizophorae]
ESYPPTLPKSALATLVADIKDYQLTHGSLLKIVNPPPAFLSEEDEEDEDEQEIASIGAVLSEPIGVSIFPTLFPRHLFEQALELQQSFNELYARVAADSEWLKETLSELVEADEFVRLLWGLYEEVYGEDTREGTRKRRQRVQELSVGIWRSDYMLWQALGGTDAERGDETAATARKSLGIKQVEFNTIACSGGAHGNIAADMHHYLDTTGLNPASLALPGSTLPPNTTIEGIVATLAAAHAAYADQRARPDLETCILMLVQPYNYNVCDERPLEHALSQREGIPTFRVEFGGEFLALTEELDRNFDSNSADDDAEEAPPPPLLFTHPLTRRTYEVSVAYFRAGHEPRDYSETRPHHCTQPSSLRSRAIKCPTLGAHLAGSKRVQAALAAPGALGRWVSDIETRARLEETFVEIWGQEKMEEVVAATGMGKAEGKDAGDGGGDQRRGNGGGEGPRYVLKPSREGGGNNVYGDKVPTFLSAVGQEQWKKYVLMDLIKGPDKNVFGTRNMLVLSEQVYDGEVASELGVFGGCLWRNGKDVQIVRNEGIGWSFKTKGKHMNEMSVVKGYGCFDCPRLL